MGIAFKTRVSPPSVEPPPPVGLTEKDKADIKKLIAEALAEGLPNLLELLAKLSPGEPTILPAQQVTATKPAVEIDESMVFVESKEKLEGHVEAKTQTTKGDVSSKRKKLKGLLKPKKT